MAVVLVFAHDHARVVAHVDQPIRQGYGVVFAVAVGQIKSLAAGLPELFAAVVDAVEHVAFARGYDIERHPQIIDSKGAKAFEKRVDDMASMIEAGGYSGGAVNATEVEKIDAVDGRRIVFLHHATQVGAGVTRRSAADINPAGCRAAVGQVVGHTGNAGLALLDQAMDA